MQRLAVHYELGEGTRDHSAVKKIIRCYKNGFSNLYSFPRACICPQTDGSNGPRDKSNSRGSYYCQSNLSGSYYCQSNSSGCYYGHSTSNLTKITSFRVTYAKDNLLQRYYAKSNILQSYYGEGNIGTAYVRKQVDSGQG